MYSLPLPWAPPVLFLSGITKSLFQHLRYYSYSNKLKLHSDCILSHLYLVFVWILTFNGSLDEWLAVWLVCQWMGQVGHVEHVFLFNLVVIIILWFYNYSYVIFANSSISRIHFDVCLPTRSLFHSQGEKMLERVLYIPYWPCSNGNNLYLLVFFFFFWKGDIWEGNCGTPKRFFAF